MMIVAGRAFYAVLATSLAILPVSVPATAEGQGPACACLVSSAGTIESSKGDVLLSLRTGFSAAQPGAVLAAGSRLIVGPMSQAIVAFGSGCQLTIDANTTLEAKPESGRICVRVKDEKSPELAQQTTINPIVPIAAGAGLAVAVGLGLSSSASN